MATRRNKRTQQPAEEEPEVVEETEDLELEAETEAPAPVRRGRKTEIVEEPTAEVAEAPAKGRRGRKPATQESPPAESEEAPAPAPKARGRAKAKAPEASAESEEAPAPAPKARGRAKAPATETATPSAPKGKGKGRGRPAGKTQTPPSDEEEGKNERKRNFILLVESVDPPIDPSILAGKKKKEDADPNSYDGGNFSGATPGQAGKKTFSRISRASLGSNDDVFECEFSIQEVFPRGARGKVYRYHGISRKKDKPDIIVRDGKEYSVKRQNIVRSCRATDATPTAPSAKAPAKTASVKSKAPAKTATQSKAKAVSPKPSAPKGRGRAVKA